MSNIKQETSVLSAEEIKRSLYRLAHQVVERNPETEQIVFLGIQTRGVYLARRLQKIIGEITGKVRPVGVLDITLYRDDLTRIGVSPLVKETKIDFDIKDKVLILIDDVLFTGRTIRAGLDEIMDFGRPKRVELLVLIDRGHRELPIRADFVGKNLPTSEKEQVEVRIKEVDGKDETVIIRRDKTNLH